MLVALDAAAVRRWWSVAADALDRARGEIDALNVFPIADGDTGTNLALTMRAVVDAVAHLEADLPTTVRTAAHAALTGARGNSGVILSAMLRGFADAVHDSTRVAGGDLARALQQAADAARGAVAQPVEGTVLSVARAAAHAARTEAAGDVAAVVRAARRAAAEALARTPSQLPALASAGVVDAGGRGLVVLLDSLAVVVTGDAPLVPSEATSTPAPRAVARESGGAAYDYEVQYLLDAPDGAIPELRRELAALGDSLVVVGGDGVHKVHVHVNDVGAAIEAGIAAGRPRRISVTRFVDHQPSPAMASRVVALVGPGEPAALFRRAGAATVDVPPTGAPSAGQVLDVIRGTACDAVVVLPNAGELRAVVDAAAALACDEGRSVVVLPTRSPVQGLSALAVHDASRRFDDDVAAMSAAAAATRVADVSRAARAAQTSAGACRAGDILGRIDDDVAVIGDDVASVARELLDRLLVGGGELVTLLTGEGAEPGVAETLLDFLAESWPTVEVTAHAGAPRRHLLVIGVE